MTDHEFNLRYAEWLGKEWEPGDNDFERRTARHFYDLGHQEALKDLWHDASEKPNGKDYVIAWDGKYASIARYKQVINCKWCYLEDLLPKED